MATIQDHALEQFSLDHEGRSVHVRDGFADGHVVLTLQGGECWHLSEDGTLTPTHPNHSVDWTDR